MDVRITEDIGCGILGCAGVVVVMRPFPFFPVVPPKGETLPTRPLPWLGNPRLGFLSLIGARARGPPSFGEETPVKDPPAERE